LDAPQIDYYNTLQYTIVDPSYTVSGQEVTIAGFTAGPL